MQGFEKENWSLYVAPSHWLINWSRHPMDPTTPAAAAQATCPCCKEPLTPKTSVPRAPSVHAPPLHGLPDCLEDTLAPH